MAAMAQVAGVPRTAGTAAPPAALVAAATTAAPAVSVAAVLVVLSTAVSTSAARAAAANAAREANPRSHKYRGPLHNLQLMQTVPVAAGPRAAAAATAVIAARTPASL